MQPYRLAARSRRSFNRVFFAASSVCEALEPRQLLSAVTMFPTDGSTNSPQVQCSEERELVVTLATPESGFNASDLTLSLSNSNGSGNNDGSAPATLSGILGTPTNPSGDEVTWIVPVIAGTSYTTSTGSLDNGIYQLSVNNSGTNSVSQFFRLFGSLDGQLQLSGTGTGADTTSFDNAYGTSSGDPGYQPDLDDTGSGSINNTDSRRYSAAEALAFTTPAAAYPTDGSASSPQVQRSEERELVVTLGTAEALMAGDLSLFLANGDGSGAGDSSASTNISSVLGTPTNPSGDGVTWIVPIAASTSYTTSTGSLDNGVYELSVSDGSTPPASFFRLFGSLDGSQPLTSSESTDFSDAYGSSSGDPGFQPDFDDTGSGTINTTDARRFGADYGLDFAAPVASASASASTVAGTTVGLTGSASGSTYSSSGLIYDWTVVSAPSGAPAPTFSANGSNAAASSTATFGAAGAYAFQVTVTDPSGQSSTSSVDVTVDQTLTSIAVTPGTATVGLAGTQQFAATALDQFGDALASQPAFTWTNSGAGSVNSSGLYTAAATAGSDLATAASGGVSGAASVTVAVAAAPTGLTATAASASQVNLSWTNLSSTTGVEIKRSTDGAAYQLIAAGGAGMSTYADTTVLGDQTYEYQVADVETGGSVSGPSNSASVSTPTAAPSNLSAVAASAGEIDLAWTDGANPDATGFTIERSLDGTHFTTIAILADPTAASYADTGLAEATHYWYQVVATTASGSASASADAWTTPAAPSGLTAAAGGPQEVDLSWTNNSASATGVEIDASADGGATFTDVATVGPTVTSYADMSASAGTAYLYQVTAIGANSGSSPSATAAVTTPADAISNLALTPVSSGEIDLTWTLNATGGTSISVSRSTDGTDFTAVGSGLAASATGYNDTGLAQDTHYWYRVTLNGSSQTYTTGTADAWTLPAAASNLVATAVGSSEIDLAWTNNGNSATTFEIESSTDGVNFSPVATTAAGATSFADTSDDSSTTYTYQVIAIGVGGGQAAAATATAATEQASFSGLAATAASPTEIDLSWTDNTSDSDQAQVWRTIGLSTWTLVATVPAGVTAYADTGLTADTVYTYYLTAVGAASSVATSDMAFASTLPATPTGVTAAADGGDVLVSWSPSTDSNLLGYEILGSSDGVTFTDVADVDASTTSYDDSTAGDGVQDYYEVSAEGSLDNSAPSAVVSATPIGAIQVNDATPANGVNYQVVHGQALTIAASALLASAYDPNNSASITIANFTQPSHGTVAFSDGMFTYTANMGYTGADSFTYTAADQYNAVSNTATVAVQVTDIPPQAQSTILHVSGGVPFESSLSGDDGDGDSLTFALVAGPQNGSLTLDSSTGAFTYTPSSGYQGIDTFTYTANDGAETSNIASVTFVVTGASCVSPTTTVTSAPSLDFSILENQAMDVGGPSDPNNLVQQGLDTGDTAPLTAQQVTDGNPAASGRTLTFNSDGSFTYTPPAGFTGTDWFTYKLNDYNGDPSEYGTVFIYVAPVNVSLSVNSLQPGDPTAAVAAEGDASMASAPAAYATLNVNLPSGLPSGTAVTLSLNSAVAPDLDVYRGTPGSSGSSVVLGRDASDQSITWTVGSPTNSPPSTLLLDGISGTTLDQAVFTLAVILAAKVTTAPTTAQATTQPVSPATAPATQPVTVQKGHLIAMDGSQDDTQQKTAIIQFYSSYDGVEQAPAGQVASPQGDYFPGTASSPVDPKGLVAKAEQKKELATQGATEATKLAGQAEERIEAFYAVAGHSAVPLDMVGYSRGAMEVVKVLTDINAGTPFESPVTKNKESFAAACTAGVRFVGLIAPVLGPPLNVTIRNWPTTIPEPLTGFYQALASEDPSANLLKDVKDLGLMLVTYQQTITAAKAPSSTTTTDTIHDSNHITISTNQAVLDAMKAAAKAVGAKFTS